MSQGNALPPVPIPRCAGSWQGLNDRRAADYDSEQKRSSAALSVSSRWHPALLSLRQLHGALATAWALLVLELDAADLFWWGTLCASPA